MKVLKGIAGSPGIAMAPIVFYRKSTGEGVSLSLEEARQNCIQRVGQLHEKALQETGGEEAKIFEAYEMLLQDEFLFSPAASAIEGGAEPVQAVLEAAETMSRVLASKGSEYMRQRADDIRYVGEMVANEMKGEQSHYTLPEGDTPFLLVAHELTPVDTMKFDSDRLAGLVTQLGGATSHTVILAKSLGIPAVVGVKGIEFSEKSLNGALDGYLGEFVIDPDLQTEVVYQDKIKEEEALQARMDSIKTMPAQTKDGQRISVLANIGNPMDLKYAEGLQYDGVGLFRSEFLYLKEDKKPTVQKQAEAYQKAIDKAELVTIRTLDIGGDKQISYLSMEEEENPFLGNRGIRLCLHHQQLFREQLEAILIAAAGKKVHIMLPMITSITEISQAKALLNEVKEKLEQNHTPYCADAALGIMIETPASAIMADQFAKYCDFFSVGTNDLIQYLLCADRGNAQVEYLYNPFHPAVIQMLYQVIQAGEKAGIPVSVCGDMAADLRFTKLLLGLGLKKFSVPFPMIARMKYKISTISLQDAQALAQKVLQEEQEQQIQNLLKE